MKLNDFLKKKRIDAGLKIWELQEVMGVCGVCEVETGWKVPGKKLVQSYAEWFEIDSVALSFVVLGVPMEIDGVLIEPIKPRRVSTSTFKFVIACANPNCLQSFSSPSRQSSKRYCSATCRRVAYDQLKASRRKNRQQNKGT